MTRDDRQTMNYRIKALSKSQRDIMDLLTLERERWEALPTDKRRTTWSANAIKKRMESYENAIIHFQRVIDELNNV